MSELKDYDIMDIEAMDDERLEKSESGKIQVTRVYIKSEADKVIAGKDKEIAKLKADYSAEVEELCIEKTNVDTLEQAWKQSQMALWLMRAYFCGRSSEYFSGMASRCKIGQEDFYKEVSEKAQRYLKASYKCQAMVEKLR